MELILVARDNRLAEAWQHEFEGVAGISVHHGSIFDVACDAVVSPANSFGFMDGGIDALYMDRFGDDIQMKLRRLILDHHHGELLIGNAELVETGHPDQPYLIAAPTMRVPMVLDETTINPYLATRAVLLLVKKGVIAAGRHTGQRVASHVKTIAFPGMGTGIGRVSPAICARQMRAAVRDVMFDQYRMPTSWAEASERHQLLYGSRIVNLQY
jgi:O-acetyl-ADP-ribose deacetylase (regulator of RNase III)